MSETTVKPIILGHRVDKNADLLIYVHTHEHIQAVTEN